MVENIRRFAMTASRVSRRDFLKASALAAGAVPVLARGTRGVAIVVDPADPIAASTPARWAAGELQCALTERGVSAAIYANTAQAPPSHLRIFTAGMANGVPEALELVERSGHLWARGHDARGLTYALLELADRVRFAGDPVAALAVPTPIAERPANTVRSITRLFTSDVEDKPWFNDRGMWPDYLSMLAAERFNRFSLAFGIGYDFLRNVTDAYFLFAYPFLLSVPGYDVRVPQLPAGERERNLEMLRYISEQTVARGLEFQLGIWMHGYEWIASPNANYTIEGLSAATHGPYCRDALRALLQAVPKISGVTFRVHGESGVEEGSYDFWKTVFDGVATSGRKVEIDMHAKGMNQGMIDAALGSKQPVKISPKFWAEHFGMPYHQAEIREQERPRPDSNATGLMKLSSGSRSFLRYGYGDLLREDRQWGVLHRIWPGTQRLLLWGDPVTAAAYSRAFSFCGSDGVEIMEPLSFKGRRGSGLAGGRCAYADSSLAPRWDWQKYACTYRVWGRLLYDPNTDPDVWRRAARDAYGPAAADVETALASASRILPTVTTAHLPSAANNSYWPEIYLNHSLIDAQHPGPYTDTPSPRVFGAVSPLDPQLFYGINEFADDLLKGDRSGKYTPIEVAHWIDGYASETTAALGRADRRASDTMRAEYRRATIDAAIAADLGRFFGAKIRAGVLYRIFERTGDRAALDASLTQYRAARDAWAALAARTKGVYRDDITVGELRQLRGHWADRLADIDADVAAVAAKLDSVKPPQGDGPVARAIAEALAEPQPRVATGRHTPPSSYQPGRAVPLEFAAERDHRSVTLHYRHVNHAERWQSASAQSTGRVWRAAIGSEYTGTPYPLQYYFEVIDAPAAAALYPGLGAQRTNQPYFVVRRRG
jgi:hypothetical protein